MLNSSSEILLAKASDWLSACNHQAPRAAPALAVAAWHRCGVRGRQRPQLGEISHQNIRALAVEELFRARALLGRQKLGERSWYFVVICLFLSPSDAVCGRGERAAGCVADAEAVKAVLWGFFSGRLSPGGAGSGGGFEQDAGGCRLKEAFPSPVHRSMAKVRRWIWRC